MAASSLLFFFFFFIIFVDGKCLHHQRKLLLDLKSELDFHPYISEHLVTWNQTDDCCQWDGVGCDGGGRVISLQLDYEGISTTIGDSSSLFRLTYLSELDLSNNDFTTTQIPNQFHRPKSLTHLDLFSAGFMGPIPSTLANLTNLVYLDLSSNYLTASSIPSFHTWKNLEFVDISDNYLMGSFSHLHFQALTNLYFLDLSYNSLNGTIPHDLFALPSIRKLFLEENQFSGQLKEIPNVNHSNLEVIDLSSNRIQGPIPNSFFQLQNLSYLSLFDNLFDGTLQLQNIQSLPSLEELRLSYNKLSVETTNMSWDGFPHLSTLHMSSCNLYDFPNLRNHSSLSDLDLSNNRIAGDIPNWIWESEITYLNLSLNLLTNLQKPYNIPSSLRVLDLHSNQLHCEFPLLPQLTRSDGTYYNLAYVLLANNSLTGVIPISICNTIPFGVLDLSFNNLSGSIPPCLLKRDHVQTVLNLRGNNINGVIPDQFSRDCDLRTFDVSDNNLGGKIPKSLANCQDLAVMNVGNNNFDDSFPCKLPPSLRILVLRSNRFHGEFRCHKSWPNLQILDISSNNFSGTLNPLHLSSWRGMMLQSHGHVPNRSDSNFLSPSGYYRDEVLVSIKGAEVKLVKIWPDFTSIDLSCNNFQGHILDAIGNLTSLYLLNLSHNALTGAIPKPFGALAELESLDLSANHLRGRIPEELAKLTFLSILNVSYNDLAGMIPTGPQFQTFPAESFEGNTGLCGFPLDRSCSSPHGPGPRPSESEDEEEIEWGYVFAALGYVVGLGSIAWTLLCCRSFRERYFEKIEEVVDKILYERGRRRRHERRVRRRAERRNAVRRHHQ